MGKTASTDLNLPGHCFISNQRKLYRSFHSSLFPPREIAEKHQFCVRFGFYYETESSFQKRNRGKIKQ